MAVSSLRREFSALIRAAPEQVWDALTSPYATRRYYHGAAVKSDWRPGSRVVLRADDGQIAAEGEVLEAEPPRRLAIRFRLLVAPETRRDPSSRLTWRIVDLGTVVQVNMVHDGFAAETATYGRLSLEGLVLRRLRAMLETGGRPIAVWKVTFDCADPPRLARFWAAALDYPAYSRDERAGSAESADAHGRGPDLYFLRVPEAKVGKNRLHLDLTVDDSEAQVRRLVGLGAREVTTNREGGETWTVMQDPEGNEFCVTARDSPASRAWPTSLREPEPDAPPDAGAGASWPAKEATSGAPA